MIAPRFGPSVLALGIIAIACGRVPARPVETAFPPKSADASGSSQRAAGPLAIQPRVELLLAEMPEIPVPRPRLELLRPTLGEVIATADAGTYQLEIEVSGFEITAEGPGLLVSLDGGRPRRWPKEGTLDLADLVSELERVEPGSHVLFGALVDSAGRVLRGEAGRGSARFFVADFSVGPPKPLPLPQTDRLFCVTPFGTFYGSEAEAVRLELFPTGRQSGLAAVRIEVPSALDWSAEVDVTKPYLIRGLPPGDVRISATTREGARANCELTLNPENAPIEP